MENCSHPLTTLFRRAAGFIPSGVAVLSTAEISMTVSSLQCVSYEPPWISVCLAEDSRKGSAVRSAGRFKARLLKHGAEASTGLHTLPEGAGLLELECRIGSTQLIGDHYLVLAEVERVSIDNGYPLVYWRRSVHPFKPQYAFLATRRSFDRFVAAWKAAVLPRAEWTHAAHVAIAAFHDVRYGHGSFERIKAGIIRYNAACGIPNTDSSGYHETLTRLWSNVVARVVAQFTDPWLAASHAVEKLGEDRDLHRLYYSFDVVRCAEARRSWIPPDIEGPY